MTRHDTLTAAAGQETREPRSSPDSPDSPDSQGTPPPAPSGARRLVSLDAARGLAIVVMLFVMNPGPVAHFPDQLRHPDWHGLSFIDMFFPLFLFVVGVSMTLSRRSLDLAHVLRRAGLLFGLGVLLATLRHEHFGVTGVLQHIAGAYLLAYAVLRAPRRWHAPLAAAVVVVLWVGFVLGAAGDPWATSGTLAHTVDEALLGSFTTEGTLQTVMSTATVVGGALAGRLVLAVGDRRELAKALAIRAAGLVALGLLLALVVPLNKRLWTPSFAVLTLGTSFAWFALGVWIADVRGIRRPLAPLVHLGANPIAIYLLFMAALAVLRNWGDALTPEVAPAGHPAVGLYAYAVGWTVLWWLLAYVLYRRRIFIKI